LLNFYPGIEFILENKVTFNVMFYAFNDMFYVLFKVFKIFIIKYLKHISKCRIQIAILLFKLGSAATAAYNANMEKGRAIPHFASE